MTLKFTESECRLLADLLEMASDDFSNHGCNDLDLSKYMQPLEINALVKAYHEWNGDPEEFDPNEEFDQNANNKFRLGDSTLMAFFASRIRGKAKAN